MSTGTNAYTCEDHTCYFVTTASFDGLLKLLPVYLDHILYPCLLPEDMALEVFSLDSVSKEARGVVYCEMKSREHTEADQMDIRLRNLVFEEATKSDEHLETYRWECGGATERVSHLDPAEISAYHKKFYSPQQITIFVSGDFSSEDQQSIVSTLSEFKFDPSKEENIAFNVIENGLEEVKPGNHGEFPADDETIGSVGFGWLGPKSTDIEEILSLHILMRALKETTASPLFQEFVECPDPCASDIDYDVRGFKTSMISLIFSGVPTGISHCDPADSEDEEDEEDEEHGSGSKIEPGLIKDRMFRVFDELLANDDGLLMYIQTALKSFTIKIKEQIEEDPHELTLGYCLPEILNNPLSIGTAITSVIQILDSFQGKSIDFWKALMQKYLIANKCHEVTMKPSRQIADTIKAAEMSNLKAVKELDKYPKTGTALVSKFEEDLPAVALPSPKSGLVQIVLTGSNLSLHIGTLPSSSFTTVSIGFNLKEYVEAELWPYFVVFQELLFQCDLDIPEQSVLLPSGHVSYQNLQQILASNYTTYEAAIGLGNELFSASYLDSHLLMTATMPADSERTTIPTTIKLVMDVLKYSQFTEERVSVTVENLMSQLSDSKRDPSTIIEAVFTEHMMKSKTKESPVLSETDSISSAAKRLKIDSDHVATAISIFSQEVLLNELRDENSVGAVIEKLDSIRRSILEGLSTSYSLGSFIHAGSNRPSDDLKNQILSVWNDNCSPQTLNEFKEVTCFPAPESLPRYGCTDSTTIVVPMADVTASFLASSVLVPLLPVHYGQVSSHSEEQLKTYLCLALFCHMLSFTEGPLYNRIRGKGLAYGAYMSLSLWNGLLSFDLNDSTAPVEAFQTFLDLLKDVIEECNSIINGQSSVTVLCETTLKAAKASFAYTNVSDRSTPSSLFSLSLRSVLRGRYPILDDEEHSRFFGMLDAMSLQDMVLIVKPFLEKFMLSEHRVTICVVPPSSKDSVVEGLKCHSTSALIIRQV